MVGLLLGLFASPVARVSALVFVAIAVVGYLRYDAAQDARRAAELEYRQEAERQITREVNRQREAAQRAVSAAEHRAEKVEAERDALRQRVDQVVKNLRADPDSACRISDDLARELRDIR